MTDEGRRFAAIRALTGLKQQELAKVLDCTGNTISAIETGRAKTSRKILDGLRRAGYNPDYVLGYSNEMHLKNEVAK